MNLTELGLARDFRWGLVSDEPDYMHPVIYVHLTQQLAAGKRFNGVATV